MKFLILVFVLLFDNLLIILSTSEPYLPDLNIALDQDDFNQLIAKKDKDPVETEIPTLTKKRKFKSIVIGRKRYYNEEQRREWREKKKIQREQMTKEEKNKMSSDQYLARKKRFEKLSPRSQEKDKLRQKANFRRHHVNRMIRIKMGILPKRKNRSKNLENQEN